jgi:hypothetical protein
MKKVYISDIFDSLKTLDFQTWLKILGVIVLAIFFILFISYLILKYGSDGPTDYNQKTKKNWKFNPYDPFSTHRHAKYDLSEYYNDELDSKEKDKLKVEQNSELKINFTIEELVFIDDLKDKIFVNTDFKEIEIVLSNDNIKEEIIIIIIQDTKKQETIFLPESLK